MFSPCFSRKTEYLHPKKAGILLPFVKLFRLPTENRFLRTLDKIFWHVITTICPLLFINFLSEKQKIFLSCICVCNSLLTLWSFSKPMLTCLLWGWVFVVNDKLRKKIFKPMKFFSTFLLTPTPFHNRDRYTKCFISYSISSLSHIYFKAEQCNPSL